MNQWTAVGYGHGHSPQCYRPSSCLFPLENNFESEEIPRSGNVVEMPLSLFYLQFNPYNFLQKQPQIFLKLYFHPCNFTFRSLFHFSLLRLGPSLNKSYLF
jgi:hypothetical protein